METSTSHSTSPTGTAAGSGARAGTSIASSLVLAGLGVLLLVLAALSWSRSAGAGTDFELLGSATAGSTVTVEDSHGPVSIWFSGARGDKASCSVEGAGSPKVLDPHVKDRVLDETQLYAVASVGDFTTGTITCGQEFYVGTTGGTSSGPGLATYVLAVTGLGGLAAAIMRFWAGRRRV
jgi:hypothetical protein